MDVQLAVVCLLTFSINLIGALAYAARIAGVRTRRIAMSFALFNVLVLLSRLSNSFLGPFLAKRIENALHEGSGSGLLGDFRLILASATAATIIGTLLIPTVQRWFCSAIDQFQQHRSIMKLLMHAFAKGGLSYLRRTSTPPRLVHIADMRKPRGVGMKVIPAQRPGTGASDRGSRGIALCRLSLSRLPRHGFATLGCRERLRYDPVVRAHRPAIVGHDR